MNTNAWMRLIKKEFPEWEVTRSKSHLVLTHKVEKVVIHTSGTPSDHRVLNNVHTKARHALAGRTHFKGTR